MTKNKKTSIKNLILYGFGSGISQLGTYIYSFAIGLYVLKLTGSGMSFAITLVLGLIPTIFISPFAGVFSDCFNKKKLVVFMDLLNGVLFIALFIYINIFELTIPAIYISTFLSNVFLVFFHITISAAKPQLVDDDKLTGINSVSQVLMAGTSVLSPMLGGFIYAFVDIKIFIIINGISFIISAFSESFIDFKYNSNIDPMILPETDMSIFESMKEGWHYMIHKASLVKLLGLFAVANFLFSFSATLPLPYILNNHIGMSAKHYGITQSILPIGMIIGAVMVGIVTKKYGFPKTLYTNLLLSFVFMGMLGLPYLIPALISTSFITIVFYSAVLLGFGVTISLIDVPIFTIIQSTTEEAYRGRVISIMIALIKAVNPIAFLLAGLLINRVNPFLLPLIGGILSVIYMILNKNRVLSAEIKSPIPVLEDI